MIEEVMGINDNHENDFGHENGSGQSESIVPTVPEGAEASVADFLDFGQSDVVDLDALFDALNIAAEHGSGGMEFIAGSEGGAETLIISGAELTIETMPEGGENLDAHSHGILKSVIVSDES